MPESPSLKLVADNGERPPTENTGLDPVSNPGFSDMVMTSERKPTGYYASGRASPPAERSSDFSPMTWVMIVIAGIVLGFAVALMLSSL